MISLASGRWGWRGGAASAQQVQRCLHAPLPTAVDCRCRPARQQNGRIVQIGVVKSDTSRDTGTVNYLLVTERVPFGAGSVPPAYRKGYDHTFADAEEHYRVRAKAQARLIHAFKSGKMGHDIEDHFPFARSARRFDPIPDVQAKVDKLIDFVRRVAPRVFPAEATTPAFLAMWREDLLLGLALSGMVMMLERKNILSSPMI